jgi:hypothetical protein
MQKKLKIFAITILVLGAQAVSQAAVPPIDSSENAIQSSHIVRNVGSVHLSIAPSETIGDIKIYSNFGVIASFNTAVSPHIAYGKVEARRQIKKSACSALSMFANIDAAALPVNGAAEAHATIGLRQETDRFGLGVGVVAKLSRHHKNTRALSNHVAPWARAEVNILKRQNSRLFVELATLYDRRRNIILNEDGTPLLHRPNIGAFAGLGYTYRFNIGVELSAQVIANEPFSQIFGNRPTLPLTHAKIGIAVPLVRRQGLNVALGGAHNSVVHRRISCPCPNS